MDLSAQPIHMVLEPFFRILQLVIESKEHTLAETSKQEISCLCSEALINTEQLAETRERLDAVIVCKKEMEKEEGHSYDTAAWRHISEQEDRVYKEEGQLLGTRDVLRAKAVRWKDILTQERGQEVWKKFEAICLEERKRKLEELGEANEEGGKVKKIKLDCP